MFDTRAAVGNLGEIGAPEFFLLLEAERTMISRDDLQIIAGQSLP